MATRGLFTFLWCGLVLTSLLSLKSQAQQQGPAVLDYNVAAKLQNSQLYDRAQAKWAEFIKKYPQDERIDRAHYYHGICLLYGEKFPEAAAAFRHVLATYPAFANRDGAQYNLAMALWETATKSTKPEDYKNAAVEFRKVADQYAQSEFADRSLYFEGEARHAAGEDPAAAAVYEMLVSKYPQSSYAPDALYALGVTQQDLDQHDQAAATFAKFLANKAYENHKLAGEIRLRQGMSLFDQQKFAEAKPLFENISKLPDFPYADFAVVRFAQCQLETGETEQAINSLKDFEQKYKESEYVEVAQLLSGKGNYLREKYEEAKAPLAKAADSNAPEAPEATYWLGRTLIKQGQAEEAFKTLQPATARFTEGEYAPYLQIALIDALYEIADRRGEVPSRGQAFLQKYADHPLAARAMYMTALTSLDQDNFAAARDSAAAFLNKYKDDELRPAVLFLAGEGHLLAVAAEQPGGDLNQARTFYEELVNKYPEHSRASRARVRIGWCLNRAGDHPKAVAHLTDAVNKISDPEHKAEAQLLIGRSQSSQNKHAEAVAAYNGAISARPDWSRGDEVLMAAALSERQLSQPEAAEKRLKELAAKYQQSSYLPQANYLLAEIAAEADRFPEAVSLYQQVVEKHSESDFAPAAAYGKAMTEFSQEKYDQAKTSLDMLLSKYPQAEIASQGRYLRGLALQRQNQFDPALKDLEAYLATSPAGEEAIAARYSMALCYVGLNKHEDAVKALADLVKNHPAYSDADKVLYELGHTQLAQKKGDEAAQAFTELTTKFPQSPLAAESWFHIGQQREEKATPLEDKAQQLTGFSQAADAYASGLKTAIAQSKLKEKLQYKLADMQFRQAKFAEAAQVLAAALGEYPQGELLGPVSYLAAESHFQQNQYDKALPLFEKAAAVPESSYQGPALYRAGASAGFLKNWQVSEKHYRDLISKFPEFPQLAEAKYGLAWALQNQNKKSDAVALYDQVAQSGDGEAAAKSWFMLGEISFEEKKHEEAIERFAYAEGFPYEEWQALARFETGRCFVELKQKEKAVAALEVVVKKYPQHPKAQAAAQLIAELNK